MFTLKSEIFFEDLCLVIYVELMVSVLWWLLLLHAFMTATKIVLTLANNLENISNKKRNISYWHWFVGWFLLM